MLGLLLLAPWIFVGWMFKYPKSERTVTPAIASPAPSAQPSTPVTLRCKPGPWGELEYSRILIEPPEDFVSDNFPDPKEIRWFFKGYTKEQLTALWQSAGLDTTLLRLTGSTVNLEVVTDGIVVRATPEFVLGLSNPARTRLYTALAAFPENHAQSEPFRFRAEGAGEWFENSGLSNETTAFVSKFLYRRGTSLIFSDCDAVLPRLESAEERSRFVKTLSRKSTLLLKLRVRPDSDIETLARYWGRGPRSKDVKPLLQSAARLPGGTTIDVVHLLPKFARSLLYTYPLPSDNPADANRDCFWTALNFFKQEPETRFADIDFVKQTLIQQYFPVPGESKLGDLLFFTRPDGTAVHACVYVADDIVFTKNGLSFAMPWILMTLADVRAFYPADQPMEIRRFREKNL